MDRLLPAAFYTTTPERIGQATWFSESVERITGFPPERFLREPDFWCSRIHPEDLERYQEAFRRPLNPARAAAEFRWHHADGEWRWYFDQSTLVLDEQGRPREVLGLVMDTTEKRSLEARLQQARKLEAVGLLAGGVAHDFNNLLMVIQGFNELIAMGLPAEGRLQSHALEVRKAVERATALTRQLLTFSRRQVVQPTVLRLDHAIADAAQMLQRLLTPGVEIRLDLSPDTGQVRSDPGQVDQVLLNLAVNGRDAMDGRGTLTVTTAGVPPGDRSRPASVPDGDWVMLAVSDSGSGMDEATMARIFEPYFTTKEKGSGTGLGLANVLSIATQNGGHVAVESAPGKGSTFRVFLPRVREPVEAGGARPDDTVPGGAETILLVDDDPHVRDVTAEMLRGLGYRVLEAAGGAAALGVLEHGAGGVRLLVTDLVMPGMFGDELARRARERKPDLRCLFISGDTGVRDSKEQVIPEGIRVLLKPYTRESLARRVREALGG